ncbi:MAG TPA: preprotein translocase subunit YajC [Methylomirabilota bacterium]|nr:preprotein translocase subunit YajC [Methylomirabilota bacterium]
MNFLFPDVAWAMAPSPSGGGGGSAQITQMVVMFGLMFAILYFLMIRPQQKQRQERERMLSAIKRGDRVVTTSGMYGTVTNLSDTTVTLRVADQVKLEFERSAIGRIVEVQGERDA